MNRGLVIGKFMPLHAGHLALINFALARCDELIVSMSYTPEDPIDPSLRFSWIKEVFRGQISVRPHLVLDNFDDERLPLLQRTKLWADFIKMNYPPVHCVFSSENYGTSFSMQLGATHYHFDQERGKVPVSATLIRQRPFRYWDFIPVVVRPYFVKKVCFYGPESTGKSTMAERIAKKYQTEFVPEVAREFISSNNFSAEDIVRIGHAQHDRHFQKLKTANKILFCDTDLITTAIYSRHYLGVVPPVIMELEKKIRYDQYFFFDIDVPWVADGLRDLGGQREAMKHIFIGELTKRNIQWIEVKGDCDEREDLVSQWVDKTLL